MKYRDQCRRSRRSLESLGTPLLPYPRRQQSWADKRCLERDRKLLVTSWDIMIVAQCVVDELTNTIARLGCLTLDGSKVWQVDEVWKENKKQ